MSMGWSDGAALDEVAALQVRCECCGHLRRKQRMELRGLMARGIVSTAQLKRKLVCSECGQKDFTLMPILREAAPMPRLEALSQG